MPKLAECNSEAYYTVSDPFHAAQYASLLTPYESLRLPALLTIAPYRVSRYLIPCQTDDLLGSANSAFQRAIDITISPARSVFASKHYSAKRLCKVVD